MNNQNFLEIQLKEIERILLKASSKRKLSPEQEQALIILWIDNNSENFRKNHSTDPSSEYVKCLVYGESGAGKTFLCKSKPAKKQSKK